MRPETKRLLNEWLYGGRAQISSALSSDKTIKKVDLYHNSPQADVDGDEVKKRPTVKKKKMKPDKPGTAASPNPHVASSDIRTFDQDVR